MTALFIWLMENDLLPDFLIRWGIRRLCAERLIDLKKQQVSGKFSIDRYAAGLASGPLAEHTRDANTQHYEVPPEFFQSVLGNKRKYSCAYFSDSTTDLNLAEIEALKITVERAQLKDGMDILEMGCGWGSLSLYMAATLPNSKILAISNSNSQREFIMQRAQTLNLKNLEVKTLDLSSEKANLEISHMHYDRIVSVEMFEHFKNYEQLFKRCSTWLKPSGKLFVHIFTHQKFAYPFETEGDDNWMGKYFFTGGQMPSKDLFSHFQKNLTLESQWDWTGMHYQKTAEAWLANLDAKRDEVLKVFKQTYGREAHRWIARWRVFFISCSELFGYSRGSEWGVTHYLFSVKS